MKKIILTGGGSAGHVTPNIALLPALKEQGFEPYYIGSKDGIEKELMTDAGVPYYAISTGKLRRYFSLKNFSDPFRVLHGMTEARKILKKIRPDVVFAKGGFVSVPVAHAAKKLNIPVILHECDMAPGLANKLVLPWASKICCNFPETLKSLPEEKAVWTGTPIRKELLEGDPQKGLAFAGLKVGKPVILVMGGSLGATAINDALRRILPKLLERYNVIHLCGSGKMNPALNNKEGYFQIEYVSDELKDLFAACDLVVSRAGANAICEIAALEKPNLLIPLSLAASRGDQILNAQSFERQGFSAVLLEENVTDETLLNAINDVYQKRDQYISAMAASEQKDSVKLVMSVINEVCP